MAAQRDPDAADLLALAVDLVRSAATLVREVRASAVTKVESKSSPTDPVTEADRAAERLVVAGLAAARPGDLVLGEEGGARPVADEAEEPVGPGARSVVRWILDPIDGTVNFVYGLPEYAVSLAAEVDGVVVAGVVRNIATGDEWTAVRGAGAWRDGSRLHGSGATELSRALVGTGFGYDSAQRRRQAAVLAELLPEIRDIRRGGSAALDLCHAAEGRLDAFYEQGLNPWDRAAGGLIAEEAGLRVGGLRGAPASSAMTLAAAPGIYPALHDRLAALDADA
jgi:myo-inositol-1(or 4)-monophosphatase